MSAEKSPEQIKREYKETLQKAKIASAAFIVTWLPYLYSSLANSQSVFGVSRTTILAIAIAGLIGYAGFGLLAWKCPSCGKFPGGGWARTSCKSCGVAL